MAIWGSPWVLYAQDAEINVPIIGPHNIPPFTLPEKDDSGPTAWSHCENVLAGDSCIALDQASFNVQSDNCSFSLYHQDRFDASGHYGKSFLGRYSIYKIGILAPTMASLPVSNSTTSVVNVTTSSDVDSTMTTVSTDILRSTPGATPLPVIIIVGASLGGLGVLALCLAIIVILFARRRRRQRAPSKKQAKPTATPTANGAGVMSARDSQEFMSMRGGESEQQQQLRRQSMQYQYQYHPAPTSHYEHAPPILTESAPDVMQQHFVASDDFAASSKELRQKHSRRRREAAAASGGTSNESATESGKRVHKKRSARREYDLVSSVAAAAAQDTAEAEELRGIDPNHVIDYAELDLQGELGSGSFGIVYRATWRGNDVAVKTVLGESGKAALISEVAKLQHLRRHANICNYFGCTKKPLSLVVEFCNGGALDERALALNSTQQTAIAIGIASGVRHLHLELVVHRDLAARNILLNVDGEKIVPKVADFGMARTTTGTTNQTKTDVGPLKWMAPEQLATLAYSEKSDVWSFGVVLYEMYACDTPWADISPPMAAHKIVSGELLPIDTTWPAEVQDVMRRCWAYEPAERPRMTAIYDLLVAMRRK